ncbi:MAG TPA: CocE/NonD family hydrolase [Myxococcota bacterium]|nr:CocE/NonD family hydrolase [Myxococcota bacterium]
MASEESTAVYHGLKIERDAKVPLRDGSHLVADVFRPDGAGRFPTIVTLGPYSKDIHFRDWNKTYDYARLPERGPYMHWETVNPEWWVPQGYVVIRVDGRGTGKSPGRIRRLSDEEARDFHDAVEWAGAQEFSNGRVAVMGISYFAMNAWRVAAAQPPQLAAIVPWEGAVDTYRDAARHGGIYSNGFNRRWASHVREHETAGAAQPAPQPPAGVTPPELFTPAAYHVPDLSKIQVPLLSAGNWGGFGLHLRGNVEGFLGAGSAHKRLQIHCGDHIEPFYSLEGRLTQKRFLDYWLCGIDTGVTREPPIKLAIRTTSERWRWRYEDEWPIARTRWTEYPLDAARGLLSTVAPGSPATTSYSAELGAPREAARARFTSAPFESETEFTGPLALRVWVSSSADDADLFVILRKLDPAGNEVTFQGSINPGFPVACGWQRVSHRKLDPARSQPWRPYHTHDELAKVAPGEIVPVEVEIWPTSIVLEPGERLVLELAAHDEPRIAPFLHDDPRDRVLAQTITLHTGGRFDSRLLLPLIPAR